MTTPSITETGHPVHATEHDPFIDDLTPAPEAPLRELDARTVDGITVVLLWRAGEPDVLLRVDDAQTGVRFELGVPGRDALQAFHHPFAYAA
jgi:hypothetical protein